MAKNWWAGAWRPASGKRYRRTITLAIVFTANGHAEVACATSDIGTGTYTIMARVAAEMLGLPLEQHQASSLVISNPAKLAGRAADRG